MSGSGKSVALHALEDAGFYCVDNLPPELLLPFVELEQKSDAQRVAIAVDVRSATSLPLVPALVEGSAQPQRPGPAPVPGRDHRHAGAAVLGNAAPPSPVRQPAQRRIRRPAQDSQHALVDAIELERELLADLREQAHVIDTSVIRPTQLQAHVKSLLSAPISQLTLVFESFAFKRGIPVDADYVFDVRMLPNPHYEPALRDLTGRDEAVVAFLQQHADVEQMYSHIEQFLDRWLEPLARDHRSYVTVAIGCTGGQHRSVYLVERLAAAFGKRWITLKRHRELDAV